MGGGRDLGEFQGNLRVHEGSPRVLAFTPTIAGLMLTFDVVPTGAAGGPKHILLNEGFHDVEVFNEVGTSLGFCRRQSDTIVFAVPSTFDPDQLLWSISDAEGGALVGTPVRISSTNVRISSTDLKISYSW